jgi:hypothetical protein
LRFVWLNNFRITSKKPKNFLPEYKTCYKTESAKYQIFEFLYGDHFPFWEKANALKID